MILEEKENLMKKKKKKRKSLNSKDIKFKKL